MPKKIWWTQNSQRGREWSWVKRRNSAGDRKGQEADAKIKEKSPFQKETAKLAPVNMPSALNTRRRPSNQVWEVFSQAFLVLGSQCRKVEGLSEWSKNQIGHVDESGDDALKKGQIRSDSPAKISRTTSAMTERMQSCSQTSRVCHLARCQPCGSTWHWSHQRRYR